MAKQNRPQPRPRRRPTSAYEAYMQNQVVIGGDDFISEGSRKCSNKMQEAGARCSDLLTGGRGGSPMGNDKVSAASRRCSDKMQEAGARCSNLLF